LKNLVGVVLNWPRWTSGPNESGEGSPERIKNERICAPSFHNHKYNFKIFANLPSNGKVWKAQYVRHIVIP
jgi:hypothetical protein